VSYGNGYTGFDDNTLGHLILMSTSSDGGLIWGPAFRTAKNAHGIGGQPLVQPHRSNDRPDQWIRRPQLPQRTR